MQQSASYGEASGESRRCSAAAPTPRDLMAFLPFAAIRLEASFAVRMEYQLDGQYVTSAACLFSHMKPSSYV